MEDLGRLLARRYRLTALLGQGGMGAVWRARDEHLNRDVAVKEVRLPDHLTAGRRETWIARLDREARAAARLRHPGIITVHDLVTGEDGRPWIVMELVQGGSLDDLIKARGPLVPQEVAAIGLRILDALDAAHQAGITHRDIKPANVLLEGERVVLTDFGIAAVDDDSALTRTGEVIGSPAFMSPEQVRGQAATAASDLWSLGATLYTAVEGRPPFTGTSTGALYVAIATEEPAPAVRAGPLAPVVGGLLRKDPAQRPTSGGLRAMLTAPPPFSGPPPMPGPPVARRHPPRWVIPAVAAAVVAVVAAVAAGVFLFSSDSAYDGNLRIAKALGTPNGFSRTAEKNVGGARAEVELTGARSCSGGCSDRLAPADLATCATLRVWIQTKSGIAVVGSPLISPDGRTCAINVRPVRPPGVIEVDMLVQNDKTLVRIEVA